VQKAGDVAGATARVADRSFVFDPGSEARQQLSIERFIVELGVEMARVLIRYAVVALLNCVECLLIHTCLLKADKRWIRNA
jgi:hypothetical protein